MAAFVKDSFSNLMNNYKIPFKKNEENKDEDQKYSNSVPTKDLVLVSPENAETKVEPAEKKVKGYVPKYTILNETESAPNSYKRRNLMLNQNQDFPDELKALLQPLNCELCKAKLNSIISARTHYESPKHEKKVNAWLAIWAAENGVPPPKRFKVARDDLPVGPNAFHCYVCDLALTSVQHSQQHYSGRKHIAALHGQSKPSGSGYYKDGKWVRQCTKTVDDGTGRFGIGKDFLPKTPPKITPTPIDAKETNAKRFCSICNIHVSCETQMEPHLVGLKHAKKLRQLGLPPYAKQNDVLIATINEIIDRSPSNCTVSQIFKSPSKIDVSIYRTPTGSFYCKDCNFTLDNEIIFQQHMDSKKHFNKATPSPPAKN